MKFVNKFFGYEINQPPLKEYGFYVKSLAKISINNEPFGRASSVYNCSLRADIVISWFRSDALLNDIFKNLLNIYFLVNTRTFHLEAGPLSFIISTDDVIDYS